MKRFILLAGCLLSAVSMSADMVPERQTARMATDFFDGTSGKGKSTLTLVREGHPMMVTAPVAVCDDPTYYVYNRKEGGFVILSADDSVDPLIAYSFEGSFPTERIPTNLEWWLDYVISGEISLARASGNARNTGYDDVPRGAGATVLQLTTANWDQGAPYNGKSPVINGDKCITGCVATAASIKCRYHEWPYRGSGTTPSYKYDDTIIPENPLGHVYEYDLMPLNYTGSESSAQKDAVATLMYDMGTGTKMMFGPSSSGAFTENLAFSLKTYFHYNNGLKLIGKSGDETAWALRLEKEMEDNGPVIYGGVDPKSGGGHQFIFDGYTDDHFFHVNWGWGGSGNGMFKTSALGSSSAGGQFSEAQDAIFNCFPDRSGIYTPDEVASMTKVKYDSDVVTVTNNSDASGDPMTFDCILSQDGKVIESKLNIAAGEMAAFTDVNNLKGTYTMTVRLTDFYVEFPDSQFSFELVF